MNSEKAYQLLGIDDRTASLDEIKTQYRLCALKYHPDKCKDSNAGEKFREIKEAYDYLTHCAMYEEEAETASQDYKTMIGAFLANTFFRKSGDSPECELGRLIVSKILGLCENRALEYVRNIDRTTLAKIYEILQTYREAFHLSRELVDRIGEILSEKPRANSEESVLLNPFLEDLQEDQLYKITRSGKTFIVPLWHHELVYDLSGADFIVRCCPVLPENMELDEYNNVYIYVSYALSEIWNRTRVEVPFGKKTLSLFPAQLHFTSEPQSIRFSREGVSRINPGNAVDNSMRSDVILVVRLVHSDEIHIPKCT